MRLARLTMIALAVAFFPLAARADTIEDQTIDAASRVLKEVMAIPLKGFPAGLMADAQGVVIVPGMIKGGFIVGVERGRGVVVVRDKNGAWQSPQFLTITGGGIGWQAGLQATDVILVFRTRSSVEGLMRGKFTIGADASVAAGPVGRQASAATDVQLKSEIYSYSRSRGLFAGVSIDGAALQIDNQANQAFYNERPGQYPQSALNLIQQIASYANPGAGSGVEALRHQLAESSRRLQAVLDPQWQQYLALPSDVFEGTAPPPEKLMPVRQRFQEIAANPTYRALAERHEFQETLALLNRYTAASGNANVMQLPPPPR